MQCPWGVGQTISLASEMLVSLPRRAKAAWWSVSFLFLWMQFHSQHRWLTNPGVAPARPIIVPPLGIWAWDRAPSQSIVSQLQMQSSLSVLQKCSGSSPLLSLASWWVLSFVFVSRGHWRDTGREFSFPIPVCSAQQAPVAIRAWFLQPGLFLRYPTPAMQATSPVSASCRTDGFFSTPAPTAPSGQHLMQTPQLPLALLLQAVL